MCIFTTSISIVLSGTILNAKLTLSPRHYQFLKKIQSPISNICLTHRCTRKHECSRSVEKNAWLWSPNQQCVQINAFNPPNLSCKKTQQVSESPDVNEHESLPLRAWKPLREAKFLLDLN